MRPKQTVAGLLLGLAIAGCANTTSAGENVPSSTSGSTPPTDVASAQEAWRQAAIDDYTLDVRITGCMLCGDPLVYSVTVTDGAVTDETVPSFSKRGSATTVDDLFRLIENYGPDGSEVTYNDVGVPVEMHLDMPQASDDQGDYKVTFAQTSNRPSGTS